MKTLEQAKPALRILRPFVGPAQFLTMAESCLGEEGQWFIDTACALAERIQRMPATYETAKESNGDLAVAHLRYFAGGSACWHITELDADTDGAGQVQAFGQCDLYGDGGELGYVNIPEILANGGELDLHYKPITLRQLNINRSAQ